MMWEKLYDFMNHLDRMILLHPNEKHFDLEMDVNLYRFANKIGFIPDNGMFKFEGRTFALC